MSWIPYKLIYRAEAPIHIGYHKLGFIQRTRYYILGRNLWGALTANLTRALGSDEYGKTGDEIVANLRLTYLYPTLHDDGASPLIPMFTEKGVIYGPGDESLSAPEFERTFIRAYTQTALEPSSLTAEEGSLHETEYIAPVVEVNGEPRPVYFVGYIFLKEGGFEIKLNSSESITLNMGNGPLKSALESIWVGGERKYGFGLLRLKKNPEAETDRLFGEYNWKENGDKVEITVPAGKPIPSHLEIDGCSAVKLRGDIEPLMGLEYGVREEEVGENEDKKIDKKIGFGQRISECKLCWMPGSAVTDEDAKFKIRDYGILSG